MALKQHISVWCFVCVSAMVLSFFSVTTYAQQSENAVKQADQLVQQWLGLSQQQSRLQSEWHQQEPVLTQRIELLRQEIKQLNTLMADNQAKGSEVEQQRAQLLALQTNMEANQQVMSTWLSQQLSKVNNIIYRLPPPLALQWKTAMDEMPLVDASNSDKLTLLLSLFTKLTDFDQRIASFESKILVAEQEERLVKQLYLGISRGWYISLDEEQVFEGLATDHGWQWRVNPALQAADIRDAIAMIEQRKEADFIRLPVSLNSNDHLLKVDSGHE
ncbi:hypothetical protein PULV_a2414 [Pseudoalteromonas ulvae UL12]|uniref:DUF3450 family protein n=1 Tax=Pseudoalteromonas ulvae TaxID=107327 RepID=UPI00186B9416|nr:DUF3450 family protein [Pseudoalteromonas ulvae]MBE0364670.1 hypothetical protein [Pseudoalteromonas ulvae UL12]